MHRLTPTQHWQDGTHALNNSEDRLGLVVVLVFAAALLRWIWPGVRARLGSAAPSAGGRPEAPATAQR